MNAKDILTALNDVDDKFLEETLERFIKKELGGNREDFCTNMTPLLPLACFTEVEEDNLK